MPARPGNPFKGRRCSGEIILLTVRWYLLYPLAYQHVAEMRAERDLPVGASCVGRWYRRMRPSSTSAAARICAPRTSRTRIDETYIRIEGED
jgi:transposase-like protein